MRQAAPPPKSPVFPLPPGVVAHHLKTLLPWTQSWLSQDRVPPVLLLTGIEGVGKRSVAYLLAQWLLCENGGFSRTAAEAAAEEQGLFGGGLFGGAEPEAQKAPGPCQQCAACRRAAQASWVEFTEVGATSVQDSSSQDDSDSGDTDKGSLEKLKIDAFRDLKASAGFSAREGSYRIVLIRNAERMTPQAANSLLKLLEEPPRGWVFILTAADPGLLLPTLVSRCQRIRLKPFPDPELREILAQSGIPADRQALSLELAQGSWKNAIALAEDSSWEKRENVLRFLENPPEYLNPVLDWASSGADALQHLVDFLEPLMLELLKWSSTLSKLEEFKPSSRMLGASSERALAAHVKTIAFHRKSLLEARAFWLGRCERLAQARREVSLPLNKKLLAQEILLPFLLS